MVSNLSLGQAPAGPQGPSGDRPRGGSGGRRRRGPWCAPSARAALGGMRMSFVSRMKSLDVAAPEGAGHGLKRTLSWPHLVALGVGAIIGTGIYTLTGVAAGLAGPAVILSFAVAGAVC